MKVSNLARFWAKRAARGGKSRLSVRKKVTVGNKADGKLGKRTENTLAASHINSKSTAFARPSGGVLNIADVFLGERCAAILTIAARKPQLGSHIIRNPNQRVRASRWLAPTNSPASAIG